eukprot:TRINITY_DN5470_c0_g1_i3.p1 TRINITY_DN5470_c0_g1~~TRINITY_DN5470_c0_g1_i3.p1  ORF type:complete len:354 (+),score=74.95 TRINITY_DN5470_c0_g1_i3:554-1615(+)
MMLRPLGLPQATATPAQQPSGFTVVLAARVVCGCAGVECGAAVEAVEEPRRADPGEAIEFAMRSVALVVSHPPGGTRWGTGIVVSPRGHILTNAHTIQPQCTSVDVCVTLSGNEKVWTKADIVYLSRQGHCDVGVLLLRQAPPAGALQCARAGKPGRLVVGDPVFAVGFHALPPSASTSPSCTSGVFSKMVHEPRTGDDVMFVALAKVEKGASGGVFLDGRGRFHSLIVANVELRDDTTALPASSSVPPLSSPTTSATLPPPQSIGVAMGLPLRVLAPFVTACNSIAHGNSDVSLAEAQAQLFCDDAVCEATRPASAFVRAVWECHSTVDKSRNGGSGPITRQQCSAVLAPKL